MVNIDMYVFHSVLIGFLGFLLATATQPGVAQEGRTTVSAVVVDAQSGAPVPNARVEAVGNRAPVPAGRPGICDRRPCCRQSSRISFALSRLRCSRRFHEIRSRRIRSGLLPACQWRGSSGESGRPAHAIDTRSRCLATRGILHACGPSVPHNFFSCRQARHWNCHGRPT